MTQEGVINMYISKCKVDRFNVHMKYIGSVAVLLLRLHGWTIAVIRLKYCNYNVGILQL